MVFSSVEFIFIFLPVCLAGYYLIGKKHRTARNAFLLVMSLAFYASGEPKFVLVMMLSIAVNYAMALLVDSCCGKKNLKTMLLVLAIALDLALLFYYKYIWFAINTLNRAFKLNIDYIYVALPLGISFFTFQEMSYIIDVYRKKVPVQRNPLIVALYVAFFPQLIAGPIVRYSDIQEEIISRDENAGNFSKGVTRFAEGLAKKTILANNLAIASDYAFNLNPEFLGTGVAWIGAVAYSLQIFFDFSGYSDMAIGLGRMFGFHILENFNFPYISKSISEFWRRWHISLSSWFRDYVYIPLGGSRKGNVYLNLLAVFALTGLWHGASWTFAVWGLWNGFFVVAERFAEKRMHLKIPKAIGHVYTLLVCVIGWVFFRAIGMQEAFTYIKCMFVFTEGIANDALYALSDFGPIILISVLFSIPLIKKEKMPEPVRIACTAILLVLGMIFVVSGTYNPFIYFNF